MNLIKNLLSLLIFSLLVLLVCSCSSTGNPVSQEIPSPDTFGAPDYNGRNILAIYQAEIDPITRTFKLEPADRIGSYHLPLTNYFPNVLTIDSFDFGPPFTANIRLKHPFPGSGIDAYDPRVIAVLPAYPSVSMKYPAFDVLANNSVLLNCDGYTKLFDRTYLPGNTNPFMAYFRDTAFRKWSSTGATEESRTWNMDIDGFGGPLHFQLVVDVSTNWPKTPQDITDNAPEPVDTQINCTSRLSSAGGEATIYVTVLDWQGLSRIGEVSVSAPDIFDGTKQFDYISPGQTSYEFIYSTTIQNLNSAPVGDYKMLIGASDSLTGVFIYKEHQIHVGFNPRIVNTVGTPGSASQVAIQGNYAYIADGDLQIIDISDPASAYIVKTVTTPDDAKDVAVSGDRAYICDFYGGFHVVDISPPWAAAITTTLGSLMPYCVYINNGYAYIGDWGRKLDIVDIDPPESSYLVKSVSDIIEIETVYVTGGYAYLTDTQAYFRIIDVEPPTSAYIVSTTDITGIGQGIHVESGYAFVMDIQNLEVIKVSNPYSPTIDYAVPLLDYPAWSSGLYKSGEYLFGSDGRQGFYIFDASPVATTFIETTFDTGTYAGDVVVQGDYAYVAGSSAGLQIVSLW